MLLTVGCRSQPLSLDAKRRFMVPVSFREGGHEGPWRFYIGHEKDPCLYLHTERQHRRYVERLRRLFSDQNADERDALRAIVGSYAKVTTDQAGRLTLAQQLVEVASLEKEVTIVAGLDRMEIWNPATFEERRESTLETVWMRLDELRLEHSDELVAALANTISGRSSSDQREGDGTTE